ncbi:hypothetical protein O3M35_002188 [Rhynocoris fuscipes]|uniref:Uncharacterized protein n=1 Tax=Rhynocoris fuscipes TaxID=488301 RepID=A0AAW1CTW1_9HEMI
MAFIYNLIRLWPRQRLIPPPGESQTRTQQPPPPEVAIHPPWLRHRLVHSEDSAIRRRQSSKNPNTQQRMHRIRVPTQSSRRALSFDVENGGGAGGGGVGSGRAEGAGSPSAVLLLQNLPQRRESFLYRSDSDFEVSPKSMSRHSSIASER